MHRAVSCGSYDVVVALIEAGANPDALSIKGTKPIDYNSERNSSYGKIKEYLKDRKQFGYNTKSAKNR